MNQALLLAFMTAFLGTAHPAYAQSNPQYYMAQSEPMSITTSLDQRFKNCMGEPNCPMQERFQIMTDINTELSKNIRKMNSTCMNMDYRNCMGIQANERRQWRHMYNQMSEMMDKIDPAYKESKARKMMDEKAMDMSTEEPAAGDMIEDQNSDEGWWRNLWENRQEPEVKND